MSPDQNAILPKLVQLEEKPVTEISREHWTPGEVWGLFTKGQLLPHKQVPAACLLFVKAGRISTVSSLPGVNFLHLSLCESLTHEHK